MRKPKILKFCVRLLQVYLAYCFSQICETSFSALSYFVLHLKSKVFFRQQLDKTQLECIVLQATVNNEIYSI